MIIETIDETVKVIVEPWACEFTLKPGEKMSIDFPGAEFSETFLEIHRYGTIIVSSPSGAICDLSIDGVNISGDSMKNPAP